MISSCNVVPLQMTIYFNCYLAVPFPFKNQVGTLSVALYTADTPIIHRKIVSIALCTAEFHRKGALEIKFRNLLHQIQQNAICRKNLTLSIAESAITQAKAVTLCSIIL
ncbi:hypothetical protein D3C73_1366470 [compost metagenome]